MDFDNFRFNVTKVQQHKSTYIIAFQINDAENVAKNTTIGQFVRSSPFDLNFPNSIGRSKWFCKVYFNGRGLADQPGNDAFVSVFVGIMECQRPFAEIKLGAHFILEPKYAEMAILDERLRFTESKCVGTKMLTVAELRKDWNRIIRNDTLTLSVHLTELFDAERVLPEMYSPLNNSRDKFEETSFNIFSKSQQEASGSASSSSNRNAESTNLESADDEDVRKKEPKVDRFLSGIKSVRGALKNFFDDSKKRLHREPK